MTLNVYYAAKLFKMVFFKAESQASEKHIASKVKSDFFQQEEKAKCLET